MVDTRFRRVASGSWRLLLAALAAMVMLASACGGDDGGAGGFGVGGDDSGDIDLDDFDLGDIDLDDIDLGASGDVADIDQVVATCDVFTAEQMTAAVTEINQSSYTDFTAQSDGASCVYTSDFHVLTVTIGSGDQVSADPSNAWRPIMAGNLTAIPYSQDSDVRVFSEDSFNLDTPYGAYRPAGDHGIWVLNTGGTGISYGAGELFAEVAIRVAGSSELS